MPADYCFRLHNDQYIFPAVPQSGECDPEEAISFADFRSMNRLLHDCKLLSKGKVLNCKSKIEFVYQNQIWTELTDILDGTGFGHNIEISAFCSGSISILFAKSHINLVVYRGANNKSIFVELSTTHEYNHVVILVDISWFTI